MKKISLKVLGVCACLFLIQSFVFSEDTTEAPPVKPGQEQEAAAPAQADKTKDFSWVWGEITKVDAGLGQVVLKYLDYETDTEKELPLIVDASTNFENVAGINDIKSGDYASVDYVAASDGKNLAKNISIEKPDVPSGETPVGQAVQPPAPQQPGQ